MSRFLTLHAQALDEANEQHTRRLAELKTLTPLLAQFEELMPSFSAKGLKVYPYQLALTHHRTNQGRMKVLRINVGTMFDKTRPLQWQDALLSAGFHTLEHNEAGDYSTAVMRRGSLLIEVDAPTAGPAKRRTPAAAEAVPA